MAKENPSFAAEIKELLRSRYAQRLKVLGRAAQDEFGKKFAERLRSLSMALIDLVEKKYASLPGEIARLALETAQDAQAVAESRCAGFAEMRAEVMTKIAPHLPEELFEAFDRGAPGLRKRIRSAITQEFPGIEEKMQSFLDKMHPGLRQKFRASLGIK